MSGSWRISIPSQAINIEPTNEEEVLKFINNEIAFYARLSINGANIVFGNQNYGSVFLGLAYYLVGHGA
jgi:hypothetical protein